MTQPTPNEQDAMKDIEQLLDIALARAQHAGIAATLDKPAVERLRDQQADEARAALLAAIRKLVPDPNAACRVDEQHPENRAFWTGVLWAQSQDAQPVAPTMSMFANKADFDEAWLQHQRDRIAAAQEHDAQAATRLGPLSTIPQAGKVLEALESAGQVIAWNCHGDCRAYSGGPIPTSAQARQQIDAAIALLRSMPQEEAAAQMQTEQDARRYRFLRDKTAERHDFYTDVVRWSVSQEHRGTGQCYSGERLDAAIDAALHRSEQSTDKEQG